MTPYMRQVSSQRGRVEWTEFGYSQLLECLGPLTRSGVFQEGSFAAALAVARLIDRGRITRSGVSAVAIECALTRYREGAGWTPIKAIERALEQALRLLVETEVARPIR